MLPEALKRVRQMICESCGFEDEDSVRILFREKDLDHESHVADFLHSLRAGCTPCVVRVLFRLLGGKGGFGALLRSQKGGKKTTNFDAMRDLTGRRMRHSKAVERIKEWMEKKKAEDELVAQLTSEGPALPDKPAQEATLDPEFMRALKRGADSRPGVVKAGLAAAKSTAGEEVSTKRQRTEGATMTSWMGSLSSLSGLSSPEGGDDSGSGNEAGEGETASSEAPAASAPAAASSSSASSSAAAPAPVNQAGPRVARDFFADPAKRAAAAKAAAAAAAEAADDGEEEEPVRAAAPESAGADDVIPASLAHLINTKRKRKPAEAASAEDADGEVLEPADLKRFSSVDKLLAEVSPDTLKRSLQKLGLKCGGAPKDRAARLFLLKDTALKDLPKSHFAPAPK
eukprot:gnl/TRDRNA2_/TRDRNA2_130983_c0_seq1.p1 gnl/TRDRNA2_/TRDRNA2_130983_c0~~gnl/TRDRNA2_/TRDRNA2_130983_c0_seq1.p1  ORF type:complete len:450 (+),score=106.71 gnl/TRDRNA2_/TRDRNA2_130983_c0_seq1:153-1352(+)